MPEYSSYTNLEKKHGPFGIFVRMWCLLIARRGKIDRLHHVYGMGRFYAISNVVGVSSLAFVYWSNYLSETDVSLLDGSGLPLKIVICLVIAVSSNILISAHFLHSGYAVQKVDAEEISPKDVKILTRNSFVYGAAWFPMAYLPDHVPWYSALWTVAMIAVILTVAVFTYAPVPIAMVSYLLGLIIPTSIYYFMFGSAGDMLMVWTLMGASMVLITLCVQYSILLRRSEKRLAESDADAARLSKLNETIQRLADNDLATGLQNRRSLMKLLESKVTSTVTQDFGLCIIDLDHFKHINDAYGHEFGDKYLAYIADVMRNSVGDKAQVSRLGGDEFAVVSNEPSSREDILAIGDKLLRDLTGWAEVDGVSVKMGASIGIAFAPSLCTSVAEWLTFADNALRAAKANERGTMRVFEPADRKQMRARNRLGSQLDKAIANRDIMPWYQPQINMFTGELVGFEALARWRASSGLHVPPPQFFELAEGRGVVLDLSEQIFRRVCDDLRTWNANNIDFGTISVNLHPVQLHHQARLSVVVQELIAAAGRPDRITLEITEDCVIGRGTEDIPLVLRQLGESGCTISLDDFGTGYASLTHIRSLPIQEVKIDKKFISSIEKSPADREIIRSILRIAKLRDISVIAEGIESGAQISLLRQEGCLRGQGYYFARPMPAADVPAYIERLQSWHDEAAM